MRYFLNVRVRLCRSCALRPDPWGGEQASKAQDDRAALQLNDVPDKVRLSGKRHAFCIFYMRLYINMFL